MSKVAVSSAEIPEFTGNLEQLELDVTAIAGDADSIWSSGTEVDGAFQGLSSYYSAPEAEQLFAVTAPVATTANMLCDDLGTAARALGAYANEVRPLVDKLQRLKSEAAAFETRIASDDEWHYDADLTDENNARLHEVNAAYSAFQAAERACANKIYALFTDYRLIEDTGSPLVHMNRIPYGYSADMLDKAEGLPWGQHVDESIHAYEIHRQVKHFVWDGLMVDFGWGTIRGIGTLIGVDGAGARDAAWSNLSKVLTGLAITITPGVGTLYLAAPDDMLPKYARDSRTALKEAGKAMIAYDQWGKDNARAAGATFGNIASIFTGAGAAGKAGTFAKVAETTGKVARFIEPTTYIVKGVSGTAKFGAVKLSDAMANLRMLGNGEYLKIGEGAYRLSDTPASRAEAVRFPSERFEKLADNHGNTIYADKANKGEWFNPDGTRYTPAVREPAAAQRAAAGDEVVTPREPALVGAGARPVVAHAGDGFEQGAARGADDGAGTARDLPSGRTNDVGSGQQVGHRDGGGAGTPPRSGGPGGGGGFDDLGRTGDDASGGGLDDTGRPDGEGAGNSGSSTSGPGNEGGAGLVPGTDPSRYGIVPDHAAQAKTGPVRPEQETDLLAELDRMKWEPGDKKSLLQSLRKDPYGAGVAELINRGHLREAEGYSKLLDAAKKGPSRSDPLGSEVPGVYAALNLATDLQNRGASRVGFELGDNSTLWDLDIYTRNADGQIDYAYQHKNLQSVAGIKRHAAKSAGQLVWEPKRHGVVIMDVHQPITNMKPGLVSLVEKQVELHGVTFLLRFEDGAITVPPNGSIYP
ncbi:hypothetical protein P8605_01150 [Streptomyces sp. T-3]|nr:hypothetical protein [Streptomyces sp. T-3]